jgi:type IV pilus assembly protein PilY1
LHEDKIMKRLLKTVCRQGLARKAMVGMVTSLYLGVALVPVAQASDTEVYTRKTTVTELAPTLMMMLDTSESMDYCMDGAEYGCTSTNPPRLTAMRNALKKILFGDADASITPVPGFVRMGFSRYNTDANKGGWVRYPARPLDAFVDINPDGAVAGSVSASAADAEQGVLALNLTSPELDLGLDAVGMHFTRINVPKGAVINEAYIEFTANRNSSANPATWSVRAHDVGQAPVFAAGANDILSRPYTTTSSSVAISDAWVKDQVYTVEVNEPVQEVVNRADWCGGNDIALRLTRVSGSGEDRYAYSYDADPAKAPRLVVNYSIDPKKTDSCIFAPFLATAQITNGDNDIEWTEGASGNNAEKSQPTLEFAYASGGKRNQVALRFAGLTGQEISRGATIDEAIITAYGVENRNSVPVLQVAAFDTANLAAFSCGGSKCAVPSTPMAVSSTWTLPDDRVWADRAYNVPVTAQVQYLVNLAGWAPTNAMGFVLRSNVTTSSNTAAFRSVEGASGANRPSITIKGRQRFTDLSKLTTVRDEIWTELSTLNVKGGTPLGAAYVETMRYMLGMPVFVPLVDPRVTTDATMTQYKSPVKTSSQCGGNYVFALTDGEPNNLANVGVNTKEIIGETCPSNYSDYVFGNGMVENWRCMLAAAEWGAKGKNQINAIIKTNTVLFGVDDQNTSGNLKRVAEFGEGTFYLAGSEKALVDALTKTVNDLLNAGATITAPGVAVNQLNRLNNLDQLFYAVFDPEDSLYWKGNVKRYRLDIANQDIYDVKGLAAVDPTTSFFKATARSWWSPLDDGEKAVFGGAASALPDPGTRNMFTYTGTMPSTGATLTRISLANGTFVAEGKSLTGIADTNEFSNLINWYKGYQITSLTEGLVPVSSTTQRRQEIAGTLHSRPILVSYGYSGSAEEAEKDPELQDNVLYFSTMEGTLHAIDSKTGFEYFTFIPGEKLAVLPDLFANPTAELPEFGMDLTWSVYRRDSNNDGKPEKVYLYGGMRMGGTNYYALDVTDRTNPKLLFAIQAGSGGYDKLGQTWSQPTVAAIRYKGNVRNVIIFGGGYDAQHEVSDIVYSSDNVGNALYIADAETGKLIEAVGSSDNADMKFSVVAQPKTLDVTGDGLVDHIYYGDLGGQMFRVDIDNRAAAPDLVARVKTLAKVGQTDAGASGVTNQRRFYEAPTVALFKDASNKVFAGIGLGSGYRSRPLNESTEDHFFMFFDYDVPRADVLTSTQLQPTIGMLDMGEVKPEETITANVAGKKGWYVALPEAGEKVINSALVADYRLVFSSYSPTVEGGDNCSPVIGRSKLYQFGLSEAGLPIGSTVKDSSLGLGGEPLLVSLESDNQDSEDKDCDANGDGVCDDFDNEGGDLFGDSGSCSDIAIVAGTDVEQFEGCVRASLKRTRWMQKLKQE